jgi:hypothetical protein
LRELRHVNAELRSLLQERVAVDRREILRTVKSSALERAANSGAVRRPFPHVYMLSEISTDKDALRRAALRYVGDRGALSHVTALAMWGMAEFETEELHVTLPRSATHRSTESLRVHQREGFTLGPPQTVVKNELQVVRLERAVVESWPLISNIYDRRSSVIAAVGRRLTTPDRLFHEARCVPNLKGRAGLLAVLNLLREGCRSQLEIFGYLHVFSDPSLPTPRLQYPVKLPARTVYLDVAFVEELVCIELDGPQYHPDPQLDHRRDAELARMGWLTVRIAPRRLRDAVSTQAEVREILDRRRVQLRLPPLKPRVWFTR